jgi:hypothetical protein
MVKKLPEELRELAISLRKEGKTYREIAGSLGVSMSTCSLWLHDIPAPPRPGYHQERVAAMWESRWQPYHVARETERRDIKIAAGRQLGDEALTDREVLIAGAMAYWCEGSKDKSYRRQERVTFINSDPALIAFFLRFLKVAKARPENIRFRLHIHENADIEGSTRFWADLVGVPPDAFQKPVIKRHNPKTVRKNLVEDYRGCLCIRVNDSVELYRRIEGWACTAMLGQEAAVARFHHQAEQALGHLGKERPVPSPK